MRVSSLPIPSLQRRSWLAVTLLAASLALWSAPSPARATDEAPGVDRSPGDGHDTASLVHASFRIPDDFPATPLWWSAVPLDAGMSPEAWAPVSEMIVGEGEFEPGRYEVSALAPGEVEFKAVVEIRPGGANAFIIPLADRVDDADADGFVEPTVVVCSGRPAGCPYTDPETGLALTVPDGWSMTQPFVYETPGGARADVASARLFRQSDGEPMVLELNPRQWPQDRGPCMDIGPHQLCHEHGADEARESAIATVRASLLAAAGRGR